MFSKLRNASNLDELKKEYFDLAKMYHPDLHPELDRKFMQEINSIFDEMKKELSKGQTSEKKEKSMIFEADIFIKIVEHLIKCEGLKIEACGWFIWITGNTKEHRATIKEIKEKFNINVYFSGPKQAWYIKPAWYRGFNKNSWSMEEIRSTYGSTDLKNIKKKTKKNFVRIGADEN